MNRSSLARYPSVPWATEDVMAIDPGAFTRVYREPKAAVMQGDRVPYARVGNIAVISIEGPLEQRGMGWGWDGYDAIRLRFGTAMVDPLTRAVLLKINSPGGVASGCFEAVHAMRRVKAFARKPVIAFADEVAYSAAYALACVADEIYLPAAGGVGSVGVITTLWDWSKMNEDMGLRVAVVTSGEQKADGHPDVPLTDEVIARFQQRTNQLAGLFAELVGTSRKMKPAAVHALQAGCFYGEDAVTAGLADGVRSFEDCMKVVESKAATSTPRHAARTEKPMQTLAKTLGLKEDATEAECLAALTALITKCGTAEGERDALTARVLGAAGATTVDAAFGTFAAWKSGADQVPALRTKITELEAGAEKRERDALIAANATKFSPALKTWAESQPLAVVKSFVESAPEIAALAPPVPQPGATAPGAGATGGDVDLAGKRWEDLEPAQKAELYRTNKPLYDALKADRDRRRAA